MFDCLNKLKKIKRKVLITETNELLYYIFTLKLIINFFLYPTTDSFKHFALAFLGIRKLNKNLDKIKSNQLLALKFVHEYSISNG